jgi:hypothetical protein
MVDATVDLEQHPGRGIGARQQGRGLDDQVIIVEHGLGPFAAFIIGLNGIGKGKDGTARLSHPQMRELEIERDEAVARLFESGAERGDSIFQPLAAKALAGLTLFGAEDGPEQRGAGFAGHVLGRGKARFQPFVVCRFGVQDEGLQQSIDFAVGQNRGEFGNESIFLLLLDAEQALQRQAFRLGPVRATIVVADHSGQLGVLVEHRVHNLAEVLFARERNDLGERIAERAVTLLGGAGDRCIEGLPSHVGLAALLQHFEMWRHLSFERKALQEPLAEAVDGMDLESAFCFECARKQAPRGAEVAVLRRTPHQ